MRCTAASCGSPISGVGPCAASTAASQPAPSSPVFGLISPGAAAAAAGSGSAASYDWLSWGATVPMAAGDFCTVVLSWASAIPPRQSAGDRLKRSHAVLMRIDEPLLPVGKYLPAGIDR